MNYEKMAKDILEHVGGPANVRDVYNCATRLRFTLEDKSLADRKFIENMNGVLAVVEAGGMFQVVIGNSVGQVCEEVQSLLSPNSASGSGNAQETQNIF